MIGGEEGQVLLGHRRLSSQGSPLTCALEPPVGFEKNTDALAPPQASKASLGGPRRSACWDSLRVLQQPSWGIPGWAGPWGDALQF